MIGAIGVPPLAATLTTLADLVREDLRRRYARGERPAAAEYLERLPALRAAASLVVSLAYEEYCLREEQGERPDPDRFCDGYGSWRDSLAEQLRYHNLLGHAAPPGPRFPRPGERFGCYLLCAELGRGAAGRVYLARDEELGGRSVVLKITAGDDQEPAILGRLDHPRIVPVLAVVRDRPAGLRALCMPFRPGRPLDEVIRRVAPAGGRRPAGALWEALGPGGSGPVPRPTGTGWGRYPWAGDYGDAAAWVALALAEALEQIHAHGILHGDVKPANVLVSLRDGPLLLDFGLAHGLSAAGGAGMRRGGTLPYMAPEQLRAFLRPDGWSAVGPRADLYGLGLLLGELLTGRPPEAPAAAVPLPEAIWGLLQRRSRGPRPLRLGARHVPRPLAGLVWRCTAAEPEDRYPDATALAEALRRHLSRGRGPGPRRPRPR